MYKQLGATYSDAIAIEVVFAAAWERRHRCQSIAAFYDCRSLRLRPTQNTHTTHTMTIPMDPKPIIKSLVHPSPSKSLGVIALPLPNPFVRYFLEHFPFFFFFTTRQQQNDSTEEKKLFPAS